MDTIKTTPDSVPASPLSADQSARPGRHLQAVMALLCVIVIVAALAWWNGPWSARLRYSRMSLVDLQRHLDQSPNDALGWRTMGLRLAREGDSTMAEPALRQAYRLTPDDAEVATGLGEMLMATNRVPEAFQILKATTEQHSRYIPAHMALGRLYRHKGSYLHASEQFETVVQLDAKNAEAWYNLAVCYLQMQQSAKAQNAIMQALHQMPRDPHYLALEGSVDAAIGNVDAGLAATQQAAQLAPNSLKIQTTYANMLLAHHRNEQDLQQADQVIAQEEQIDPNYPLLSYQHGELERLRQHWPQAVRYLERALQAAPDQDEIYFSLSQAYRRVGRIVDADRMLTRYRQRQDLHRREEAIRIAMEAHPDSPLLYEQLADLQMQLADRAGALNSLNIALQMSPGDAKLQQRLTRLKSQSDTAVSPQAAP